MSDQDAKKASGENPKEEALAPDQEQAAKPPPTFSITLNLNVLNHLGINLYSSIPAVLAEVVANAWDADAQNVEITIDKENRSIVIEDDGHGMSKADINGKYLNVGYQRRAHPEEAHTAVHHRPVMGRKGIGKLSLFSIADEIELFSVKDAERNGLRMRLPDIQEKIKDEATGTYNPEPIAVDDEKFTKGTRIVLKKLRKQLGQAEAALRKRLARRFSVLGAQHKFEIMLNGAAITPADRDYFHKVQFLWEYGDTQPPFRDHCKNVEHYEKDTGITKGGRSFRGWIGTVKEAGDLKADGESLNKVVLMVRGKLAQEDVLEGFGEGGIYTKYIIGEIHGDFLDEDDKPDIATSSRQSIIEDDPRYTDLIDAVHSELKKIQGSWTDLRNDQGTKVALDIPAVKAWFEELGPDNKKRAQSLFGKINQLTVDSAEDRRRLLKHGVLAFESLRNKQNLDALEKVSVQNLAALSDIFLNLDDMEATLYHQIVSERLQVIKKLQEKVDQAAKEKVIQEHLFKHLWILDPSWERATASPYMEQQAAKEFAEIDAGLTEEERKGRLDIKYTTTSGKHVIVELKRADRVVSTYDLVKQVAKYREAIVKLLAAAGRGGEPVEFVCVVGRPLKDWAETNGREDSKRILETKHARVVLYDQLLEGAYAAYKEFVDKNKEAGRVYNLIRSIDEVV